MILIGLPNVGKSQILAALTKAIPEIAAYPFTTKVPMPGMMHFEDVQIQLIDTPPLGHKEIRILFANTLRGANIIAIAVDLSLEPLSQVENVLQELREAKIEPACMGQLTPGSHQKRMLIVGNKNDQEGSNHNWKTLYSHYAAFFPMVSISARENDGLDELKKTIYHTLDIIRVYTKIPGTKAELSDPMILRKGSTVEEAAEDIHKDFRAKLKYAVVWGSGKYEGQRVGKKHVLHDIDVIEFHT